MFRGHRSVLTLPQMMPVYFAYVESRLRYGIAFWGLSALAGNVFVSQKKVLRCLAGVRDDTYSCRQLFKDFGILTLSGLFIFEVAVRVFTRRGTFTTGAAVHKYETR